LAADLTADGGADAVPALEAGVLSVTYGAIRAVQDVSLVVRRRTVTALVGSNGAGKSSILRALAGLESLSGGSVKVDGVDVAGVPGRRRVVEHGIVLVPEGRSTFVTMTVRENLELGRRVGAKRISAGRPARFSLEQVWELFPVLHERERQRAQYLSGGEQQMLAIARSLLMEPSILLIDEPSMGLAPLLVRRVFSVMADVFAATDVAVLLVEQDTAVALDVAADAYLLEHGRIVAAAPAAELRADPRLRAAYLGTTGPTGDPIPALDPDPAVDEVTP
jgi:branched-chain amino acid transport system ATP-binding protein